MTSHRAADNMQAQNTGLLRLLLAMFLLALLAAEQSDEVSEARRADSESSIFQMDKDMFTSLSPLSVVLHNQW